MRRIRVQICTSDCEGYVCACKGCVIVEVCVCVCNCPCLTGAGQDVGKSCVIVTVGGKNIMFDCGMHMGYQDERRFPDFSFISKSGDFTHAIDCVIITHLYVIITPLCVCPLFHPANCLLTHSRQQPQGQIHFQPA